MVFTMKMTIFFLAFLFGAFCQQRPNISENFAASGNLNFQFSTQPYMLGSAQFIVDHTLKSIFVSWQFPDFSYLNTILLHRFDLGESFELDGPNPTTCTMTSLSGSLPWVWAWIKGATYQGRATKHGMTADLWENDDSDWGSNYVAVPPYNNSIPVWVGGATSSKGWILFVQNFTGGHPSKTSFAIPAICQNQSISGHRSIKSFNDIFDIGRCHQVDEIIRRMKTILTQDKNNVLSMVDLISRLYGVSFSRNSIEGHFHRIEEATMKEGDLIMNGDSIVLFKGWLDQSKREYLVLKEDQRIVIDKQKYVENNVSLRWNRACD